MSSDSINGDQSAEDVLKLLDSLDQEATTASGHAGSVPAASTGGASTSKDDGDDILGFLDSLTNSQRGTPVPAAASETKTAAQTPAAKASEASTGKVAPKAEVAPAAEPAASASTSNQTSQPIDHSVPDPISSITSWWSKNKTGLWDTATSAVKQAEARVRELQPEVVGQRGIDSLGDSFSKFKFDRHLLQSTLSSIVDSIAPPLERHEQLQIHVFHDMVGYSAIDGIVYSVFERVMDQVEGGGELKLVVQKGKERNKIGSDAVEKRELGIFRGSLEQGQKLAKASIDEYLLKVASEKGDASADTAEEPEQEEQAEEETTVDENGIVSKRSSKPSQPRASRVSNIYLSLQAVAADAEGASSTGTTPAVVGIANSTPAPTIISSSSPHAFQFIVYLTDPEHNINFSTVSQSFPLQWAEWLDSPDSAFESGAVGGGSGTATVSADPREWVIDWVEEGLGLSVGVVAQTYVSKRMGLSALPPTRAPTPAAK